VLLVTGLFGRAPEAPAGTARFLRVATFNFWGGNEHTQAITKYVDRTDAGVHFARPFYPRPPAGRHPDAIGLTVPNMPIGSPGMEQPGGEAERYGVLLVKKDGAVEVFAHHQGPNLTP